MAKQHAAKPVDSNPASPAKTVEYTGFKKLLHPTQEEKVAYTILLGLMFIVVLIRSNFYGIPFERDEGTYGYYGKLLLDGKIPYKDFYEQKFPGIFYFYAIMVGLFGETVKGLHMGFMLLNIGTFLLLFAASRRLFSPIAGAITAVTYAVVSLTPNLSGFTVQGEHGVAFFVSLGIYFYSITLTRPNWKYFLLTGIAMGCAFMVKTSGVFLVLWGGIVILSDYIFGGKKPAVAEIIKRGLIYSIGVFSVVGILFLIIAIKGSFNDMLFWAIEVPKRYVGKVKWEQGKQYLDYTLKAITTEYKFFWVHAFLALLVLLLKSFSLRTKIMALSLIFFSCATIFPGYYFYGHYWIQILPGLSILAGLAYTVITGFAKNTLSVKWPKLGYAYLSVFVLFTLIHLNGHKDYYFNPNYDRIMRTVYGNNPFPEAMAIANYINTNASADDQIIVMGSEPEIYFYTKKTCPSRHAYFAALVDSTAEHKQFQKEFIQDVEKSKPKYFIFFNHQISLFVQRGADVSIFDWYNKYITANYNLIGLVDMVDGYTSTYVWKEQLNSYKIQAQSVIYIYERKPQT